MSADVWKKIIEELAGMNFAGRISPHHYGEPLMDKRLPEFVAFAREKCPRAEITIASNGDFLTDGLASELIRGGLDFLIITNCDDLEKPGLTELCRKYPSHLRYRSYKDIRLQNKAGMIFDGNTLRQPIPCLRPRVQLVINWKGNIVLCCNDYYDRYIFGNVKNESILEAWNSSRFREFRRILQHGMRSKIDICRDCDSGDGPDQEKARLARESGAGWV